MSKLRVYKHKFMFINFVLRGDHMRCATNRTCHIPMVVMWGLHQEFDTLNLPYRLPAWQVEISVHDLLSLGHTP